MKPEKYYKQIESKWNDEYPSPRTLDEIWKFYLECGYENPQRTITSILKQVPWEMNNILDFGCDNGLMLKFICDTIPELKGVGIDINSKAIEKAKQDISDLSFQHFDGIKIPFDDKIFDLLFACAVIKHIRYEDREQIYNEINRVSNYVFFIETDSKKEEIETFQSWKFYHSNFDEQFKQHFIPIKVIHEAGDILGLYQCK